MSFFGALLQVDGVRISQLYEQARWSVLTEDVDCTEEETYTFAALQVRVIQRTKLVPMGLLLCHIGRKLSPSGLRLLLSAVK